MKEKCSCGPCVTRRAKYYANAEGRARGLTIQKARRASNKAFWVEKLGGKCVDCGQTDVRLLTFDHNGGRKEHSVSALMSSKDPYRPELVLEIGRCKLRCLNCHAIKTSECGDFKPKGVAEP